MLLFISGAEKVNMKMEREALFNESCLKPSVARNNRSEISAARRQQNEALSKDFATDGDDSISIYCHGSGDSVGRSNPCRWRTEAHFIQPDPCRWRTEAHFIQPDSRRWWLIGAIEKGSPAWLRA
ncbi:MAG: hypothetical protein DRI32_06205 [Chloroflexi bacterium]|nr:MAG: hypothetical protein DRI32_06205 [Chloroflexota bacterium]